MGVALLASTETLALVASTETLAVLASTEAVDYAEAGSSNLTRSA
jgi:hypothetical protein